MVCWRPGKPRVAALLENPSGPASTFLVQPCSDHPRTMCPTPEAYFAKQRGEEVVEDFARLYPEHKLRKLGRPAKDLAARRSLGYLGQPAYEAMLHWGRVMADRRRQVAHDIRTQGDVAVEWYMAVSPDYLPKRFQAPRRAECSGRPAAGRRRSSSVSSRGDPDLGDEPPGHRPPSCEGAAA
jgi:hypothetical protein